MTLGVVGRLVTYGGETTTFGDTIKINIWLITGVDTSTDIEVPTPSNVVLDCRSSIFGASFYGGEVYFNFLVVILLLLVKILLTLPLLKCIHTQYLYEKQNKQQKT